MTPQQLANRFPHASQAFRLRNPHLFTVGAVQANIPEPTLAKALVTGHAKQAKGAGGVVVCVSLIACLRRELDSDNLSSSLKWLRDAIASTLNINDNDKRVRWQYGQMHTQGEEGVIVRFEI